jgi:hypothetical protein
VRSRRTGNSKDKSSDNDKQQIPTDDNQKNKQKQQQQRRGVHWATLVGGDGIPLLREVFAL